MSARIRGSLEDFGVSVLVAVVALALSFGLIALTGTSAVEAAQAMWDGAFGGERQIAATMSDTVVLVLLAVAWCVTFTGMRINVGLEGQALVGGALAAVVALKLDLPGGIHLFAAMALGFVGGALWAGIAAWLWARRGVNEIISTLLLNLIALQLVSWLVRGPLQEPTGAYPQTAPLPDSSRWPDFLAGNVLTWDWLLAPLLVVGVALLLRRTTFGFALRATGANEHAAAATGISPLRAGVVALLASGGIAGLAGGAILVGGETTVMSDNFLAGRGYEAIAVALLARNKPIACIPAALLFAMLAEGGGLMEARVGVPAAVVQISQGTVIVLVAAAAFFVDRRRRRRVDGGRSGSKPTTNPEAVPHGAV